MRNDKGFTLIELLAIVVILAIIMVLAVPNITKEIDKIDKQNNKILNQKIENAAHIYAAKYYADKIVDKEKVNFTLQDLVEDGLISFNNDICKFQLNKIITILDGKNYDYSELEDVNCYNSIENKN